ncbi:MAG: tyrosine-type recombinase/integrase [Ornithinibacter sp.]
MSSKRTFGQISRLPSRRYRARYTGPDTALHSAPWTFETKGDAEAWLVDERRLISSGRWSSPKVRAEAAKRAEVDRRGRKFKRYAQEWLDSRHDLRPTTRGSYQTSLDRHLAPWFGEMLVDELSVVDVRAWFASYGEKTPTARAHAYAVLTAVMGQALEDELITRTPCRVKSGGRAKVQREPEVLTLAELLALAEAMPEHQRALTLLCGLCGLRFGEAVALRRRDLDLDRRLVQVTRTATRDGRRKTTGAPKTAAGSRTVAMPQLVADAVRTHIAGQPVTGRDALVFPGRDGELLSHSSLYGLPARVEHRNGRVYRKEAFGFTRARGAIDKPGLNWHDLRRTAATLGAQAGATVREMQNRLGHATPAMALYYQGATAERDLAIADRLQETIDKAGAGRNAATVARISALAGEGAP